MNMILPWHEEVRAAAAFAIDAHRNQKDLAGRPFIGHPFRVAAYVAEAGRRDLVPAAYLHDVVEDTDHTLAELTKWGFSVSTVSAVEAMTHLDSETYKEYIGRVADSGFAALKLADLSDNLDPNRLAAMTAWPGYGVRVKRYQDAVAILTEYA